ncbi:MAG TPA: hypothetical protein ENK31_02920 [Nannocystis exedens]|nr:hypothetical protein [Nannocystis exedens]
MDLEINAEGYLAEIKPSPGVDPLIVACLKRKLERTPLSVGGQSTHRTHRTHRIPLASLLRSDGEHDED